MVVVIIVRRRKLQKNNSLGARRRKRGRKSVEVTVYCVCQSALSSLLASDHWRLHRFCVGLAIACVAIGTARPKRGFPFETIPVSNDWRLQIERRSNRWTKKKVSFGAPPPILKPSSSSFFPRHLLLLHPKRLTVVLAPKRARKERVWRKKGGACNNVHQKLMQAIEKLERS